MRGPPKRSTCSDEHMRSHLFEDVQRRYGVKVFHWRTIDPMKREINGVCSHDCTVSRWRTADLVKREMSVL